MNRWMSVFSVLALCVATTASAQWNLSGTASIVNDNGPAVQIIGPNNTYNGGGYSFTPPAPFTFGQLTSLSVDFKANYVALGSPRVVVRVNHPVLGIRNIEVYLGPQATSWYDLTPMANYAPSGNLIGTTEARWEIGAEGHSSAYGTYADAAAVIPASSPVTQIYIVADSGYVNPPNYDQQVRLKNFTIVANGVTYTGNGKFVVDTRNVDTIFNLNNAVAGAHSSAATLPAGNPYVDLGKTAEGQAYAAHVNASLVTYLDNDDFPAALAAYKQLRYQQATYHGRAAQYFAYGGSPANGSPRTFSLNAKNIGTVDFNAP